jgi:hypothetical protein
MDIGRKSARIGLLVAVATLVSGGAAHLNGPPAACAFTNPFAGPFAPSTTASAEPRAPKREVKTIGMMLAEHPPV